MDTKIGDTPIRDIIAAIINHEYFLITCYTIFGVALFVYIYTAVVICRKGCSGQNRKPCAAAGPVGCVSFEPENWLIATQIQKTPLNIFSRCGFYCALGPLQWINHDNLPCGMLLMNTGQTVTLTAIYMCRKPKLCGASLAVPFGFVQVSFAWANKMMSDSSAGHLLNGQGYPLEMHVTYYYGARGGGICATQMLVLAYLFQVGGACEYLDPITSNLKRVKTFGTKFKIPTVALSAIVPTYSGGFFCYIGSTFDPPYSKGVKWLVYSQPLTVSHAQLKEFYKLLGPDSEGIQQEQRPACNIKTECVPTPGTKSLGFSGHSNAPKCK